MMEVEEQQLAIVVAKLVIYLGIVQTRIIQRIGMTLTVKVTKNATSVEGKVILLGIAAPGIPTFHLVIVVARQATWLVIVLRHQISAIDVMKRDTLLGTVQTQARNPVTNVVRRDTLPVTALQNEVAIAE